MGDQKSLKEHLLQTLKEEGILDSSILEEAFRNIDRKDFVPEDRQVLAYENSPVLIGYGQTISQPYTVAFMLGLLDVKSGNLVLDIGSGSGWTMALLAYLVGEKGRVVGLEIIRELVQFGQKNLHKYHFQNAQIFQSKEGVLGVPGEQFDRILVSASADVFPSDLLDQLKQGGRLVIPIQDSIFLYKKDQKGEVVQVEFPGFVFVRLRYSGRT